MEATAIQESQTAEEHPRTTIHYNLVQFTTSDDMSQKEYALQGLSEGLQKARERRDYYQSRVREFDAILDQYSETETRMRKFLDRQYWGSTGFMRFFRRG